VSPNASSADTLKAYNRLLELKKRIESGEDFATVATGKDGSEDPSVASNGGDLGFFTAFQMVYPFEEAAYTTPVGKISKPFRTRFGYHILKVTDKREARGTITSAHIMVSVGKDADEATEKAANGKINEIYTLLEGGEAFEVLVARYSDDPSSNKKDGVLPAFGTGATTRMVPEFEEAAFSLTADGEFSKPIRTDYGFHIVKRISLQPVPSFEEMKEGLAGKVSKDERSKTTQDSFVAKLKKEYGYKNQTKKTLKWFEDNIDSNYYRGNLDISKLKTNSALFVLDGKEFKQQDFAIFLKAAGRKSTEGTPKNVVAEQYSAWEKQEILAYEESKLADKYPAYKALITEYHDGILLYEIMSDKVWNHAMKDTTGLQEFYEKNKANYVWGERIDADVYECNSNEVAQQTLKLLGNDTLTPSALTKIINKDSELNVRHRNSKYELEKVNYLTGRTFKKGVNPAYEVDDKVYVVVVNEQLPSGQKAFNEAKGTITSDYQTYLEKEWIEELKAKHKVTINKEALYAVGK